MCSLLAAFSNLSLSYIPVAVVAASSISFYGTSPIIQQLTGLPEGPANSIALASVGPLLSPLYARQEGGITLVSLWKNLSQAEALKIMKKHATLQVLAPGTLFTFLRNSISLGVGGALAADGGEAVSELLVPEHVREAHPLASKLIANGVVGVIAGAMSSLFEFLRISKVIAAGHDEQFSFSKHFTQLLKQRSFLTFAALRSSQLGCFYACFIAGGHMAKENATFIQSQWMKIAA